VVVRHLLLKSNLDFIIDPRVKVSVAVINGRT
jgi:hypothetical protein